MIQAPSYKTITEISQLKPKIPPKGLIPGLVHTYRCLHAGATGIGGANAARRIHEET
jgi:hypothetical protein